MATGTPSNRRAVRRHLNALAGDLAGSAGLHLTYAGKKAERDILATPPSRSRLLWRPAGEEGPAAGNRLFFGDNMGVLAQLLHDPAVKGHVGLVYIDPPFATESNFHSRDLTHAYSDTLAGSAYVEFIRERLILLRELIAIDGSIYVHLDDKMVFHVKVIMDEVFGPDKFRNCITRRKCSSKNYTRNTYGNTSDYILFYTKGDSYVWHRPMEKWTPERMAKEYPCIEEGTGRRYKKVPVHAPGTRRGQTGGPWRGMLPPSGKHWQYIPRTLDEMNERGEIYWSPTGNPRRKVYLDESDGVAVQDIWLDYRDSRNQNTGTTGYPTEKNRDMLARIIQASSNPGDLILDCFCGSGTTLETAARLGRRWIGVDNSVEAIKATVRRLLLGAPPMGDYVAHMQDASQMQDDPRTPGRLFDLPDESPVESAPQLLPQLLPDHDPIINFDLLIDDAMPESTSLLDSLPTTPG